MGMVVLRSTTPCVADSSRSNSDLLTVISITPVPTAGDANASTGISTLPPLGAQAGWTPRYIKSESVKLGGRLELLEEDRKLHRGWCEMGPTNVALPPELLFGDTKIDVVAFFICGQIDRRSAGSVHYA